MKNGEYKKAIDIIKNGFERFVSLCYENLCEEWLKKTLKSDVISSGSYWSRNTEIDIFLNCADTANIAAEVKWKHLMCKNILTNLRKKCEKESLRADVFALFSKSGFSKELLRERSEKVILIDLAEFGR